MEKENSKKAQKIVLPGVVVQKSFLCFAKMAFIFEK